MSLAEFQSNPSPTPKTSQWLWSREAFQRLSENGTFTDNDRVELIQGVIVSMSPPNPEHSGAVNPVSDLMKAAFGSDNYVRTEQPLIVDGNTQPQPDVLVCRGSSADYRRRFPVADDVLLVIEIADSSLENDREKGNIYAHSAISEYWILNLRDRCVEVYREPDSELYLSRRIYRIGESISPLAAPDSSISVAELYGE
jgi:Uma2 family endonuclease